MSVTVFLARQRRKMPKNAAAITHALQMLEASGYVEVIDKNDLKPQLRNYLVEYDGDNTVIMGLNFALWFNEVGHFVEPGYANNHP